MNGSVDHDRLIGNLVMLGVVTELDEAAARVRVDADGLLTDWLPWSAPSAGPGVREWSAPGVGEQVVIACPCGDPAQAVVIGRVYQDAYPAPANVKTVHRTEYDDGTVIEYDRAAHRYTIDVGTGSVVVNCKTATVAASESVTLDTPTTHCTGELIVDGKATLKGDADVQGNTTVKAITSNGKAIDDTHRHGNGNGGAPTTAPL